MLTEACCLYESAGYHVISGVETERCDIKLQKTLEY